MIDFNISPSNEPGISGLKYLGLSFSRDKFAFLLVRCARIRLIAEQGASRLNLYADFHPCFSNFHRRNCLVLSLFLAPISLFLSLCFPSSQVYMCIFLLFSLPLFFQHFEHRHRDERKFQDFIQVSLYGPQNPKHLSHPLLVFQGH